MDNKIINMLVITVEIIQGRLIYIQVKIAALDSVIAKDHRVQGRQELPDPRHFRSSIIKARRIPLVMPVRLSQQIAKVIADLMMAETMPTTNNTNKDLAQQIQCDQYLIH
jgi:hypothetical protein